MVTKPPALPKFRELDDSDSRAVLARHHVGRLAITLHDRVDVEPISYEASYSGTAYFLAPGIRGDHSYDEAVGHLRSIDARALTHDDLAPHRTVLFRIHVDDIAGRAASTHE
jgi:nitroimidazol reductase NimA-like FMN-containing flavoprotein (pyridoxamine 5'-phosphate oxidase superfamily)